MRNMKRDEGKTLVCLLLFISSAICLRVKEVTVPGYSANGDSVDLNCLYDLEGDQLYSVKWYKGFREFFRYIPGDNPKIQVFDVPGVHVDMAQSSPRKVILKKVSRKTSGKYKCEVSAEAPSFHTDSGVGELLVADLPENVPIISGLRQKYHVGDIVNVNCTSSRSKPAAALSWYINGKKADQSFLVDYTPVTDREGLETSILGLRFMARPLHLRHGDLRLRCTATIASVYFKENSIRVKGKLTHRTEPYKDHITLNGNSGMFSFSNLMSMLVTIQIITFVSR